MRSIIKILWVLKVELQKHLGNLLKKFLQQL